MTLPIFTPPVRLSPGTGHRPFLYALNGEAEPRRWTCSIWTVTDDHPAQVTATFPEDFSPLFQHAAQPNCVIFALVAVQKYHYLGQQVEAAHETRLGKVPHLAATTLGWF